MLGRIGQLISSVVTGMRNPLPVVADWFARLEAGAMRRARLRPGFWRIAWLQFVGAGAWHAQNLRVRRMRLEWKAREPGCDGQMLAPPDGVDLPTIRQLRRRAVWRIEGFTVFAAELRESAGRARRMRRCMTLARKLVKAEGHAK